MIFLKERAIARRALRLPQPARAGIGWCLSLKPKAEKHSTNPKGFSPKARPRAAARMRVLA